jgi:hypothetical protein
MQQAADQWSQTTQARVLAEVPYTGPQADALRKRLRDAYLAGYQDGRKKENDHE